MKWERFSNPLDEPFHGLALVRAKSGSWQNAVNRARKFAKQEPKKVFYVDSDPRLGKRGWVVWTGPHYTEAAFDPGDDVIDVNQWHGRYMEYKVSERFR